MLAGSPMRGRVWSSAPAAPILRRVKSIPSRSIASSNEPGEPLVAVKAMIAELGELRQGTRDRALLGAYQAALDRLEALAFRLREASPNRIVGLPAPRAVPEPPAPKPSQRTLPLGPVVVARRPKRR